MAATPPDDRPTPAVDPVRRTLEIDASCEQVRTAITLTMNLPVAPVRLWPLLTRADELSRWYGPVAGDLAVGGRFEAPGPAGGRARGTVLDAQPPHRLTLTWERGDDVDGLELRLDPEDDGTTSLRLAHAVICAFDAFDPVIPGIVAVGWEIALLGLAAETDAVRADGRVPAPTPEWLASDEGLARLRAWCVRWAAQAIAAGADETVARRMEQEIAAAYGEVSPRP